MEKLKRMSQKELEKVLVNDIYRAKYATRGENWPIYKILYKLKDITIIQNTENGNINNLGERVTYLIPLTIAKWREYLKKENTIAIYKYLDTTEKKIQFLDKIVKLVHKGEYEIVSRDEDVDIILHYPELVITNSGGIQHKLQSVFVKYSMGSGLSLLKISMARTTYTESEYSACYKFSHCKSDSMDNWSTRFCYGESKELNLMIAKCVDGNIMNLKYLIFMFKEYLCWESLEGIPYNYISNIKSKQYRSYYVNISDDTLKSVMRKVYKSLTNFKYSFGQDPITVVLDESSLTSIENLLTDTYPEYCCSIINNADCIEIDRESTTLVKESKIVFKGSTVSLVILPDNTQQVSTPKRISRQLLQSVTSTIEEEFLEFLIQNRE